MADKFKVRGGVTILGGLEIGDASTGYSLPTARGSDGQTLVSDANGVLEFAASSASPGGSTTQVQYNNAGVFAGSANFTATSLGVVSITGELNVDSFKLDGNTISVANSGNTNEDLVLTPKGTGTVMVSGSGSSIVHGGVDQNLVVKSGDYSAIAPGALYLRAGDSTSGAGGNIYLSPGAGTTLNGFTRITHPDGSNIASFEGTAGVTSYLTFNHSNSTLTLKAAGSVSDIGIILQPKGTGFITAPSGYDMSAGLSDVFATKGYVDSQAGSLTLIGDVTGSGSGSVNTTLSTTGVGSGTYKSVTVDAKGRVTAGTNPTTLAGYGITDAQALDPDLTSIAALSGTSGLLKKTAADTWSLDASTYLTANQSISLSGDASGSGTTSISVTLANAGSAGTYTKVTTDSKGRVTSGSNPTTVSGYGITDAVTGAANVGIGAGTLFTSVSGGSAQFKTIKAGTNITLTNNTNDVTIDASGAGGSTKYEWIRIPYTGTDRYNTGVGWTGSSGVNTATFADTSSTDIKLTITFTGKNFPPFAILSYASALTLGQYVVRVVNNAQAPSTTAVCLLGGFGGFSGSAPVNNPFGSFSSSMTLTIRVSKPELGFVDASVNSHSYLLFLFGN